MKAIASLLLLGSIDLSQASTRLDCEAGDHSYCELTDGEGACCATISVTDQGYYGDHEEIGDEFLRCYDIDDILDAISNDYVLTDTSENGNGNTYDFRCSRYVARAD